MPFWVQASTSQTADAKPAVTAAAPVKAETTKAAAAPKPAAAAKAPVKDAIKGSNSKAPPNVLQARQWIANWRASVNETSATASKPKIAASNNGSSNGNGNVPANVLEARQWIANWRAGLELEGVDDKEQDQNVFTKLFSGLGGNSK